MHRTTLRGLVADYRSCELATISKAGVPIAWPTFPWVDEEAGTVVLTTSIALPQKAYNIRRDPRVALLFSDPTGSGRGDLEQVLVQGTATCPQQLHTSPAGLEEYWLSLWARQPVSSMYSANAVTRWLTDWYYMRLVITVSPSEVTRRPPLVEDGLMTPPSPVKGDRTPYAQLVRGMPEFRSAVLGTVRDGELPVLRRVRLTADPSSRLVLLGGPDLDGLTEGPASLLLHRHDDKLWDLKLGNATGVVEQTGAGWAFRAERGLPGLGEKGSPLDVVRTMRDLRRTAAGYLTKRNLPRPVVAWDEMRALKARGQSTRVANPS